MYDDGCEWVKDPYYLVKVFYFFELGGRVEDPR